MGRDIAFHVHPLTLSVFLGICENFVEGPVIEIVFELVRKVGVFRGFMLRPPVEAVIFFPFPFERFAVAGPGPEFRLFHENGVDPCIDHPFHVHFFHVFQVILGRDDIRYHVPVPDSVSLYCYLTLVEVPFPVPFSCEIVLVLAPGDSRHEVGDIPSVPPGFHPFFECESFSVFV